jgi:hypothetical protein
MKLLLKAIFLMSLGCCEAVFASQPQIMIDTHALSAKPLGLSWDASALKWKQPNMTGEKNLPINSDVQLPIGSAVFVFHGSDGSIQGELPVLPQYTRTMDSYLIDQPASIHDGPAIVTVPTHLVRESTSTEIWWAESAGQWTNLGRITPPRD